LRIWRHATRRKFKKRKPATKKSARWKIEAGLT
jgi:hypothetical protein